MSTHDAIHGAALKHASKFLAPGPAAELAQLIADEAEPKVIRAIIARVKGDDEPAKTAKAPVRKKVVKRAPAKKAAVKKKAAAKAPAAKKKASSKKKAPAKRKAPAKKGPPKGAKPVAAPSNVTPLHSAPPPASEAPAAAFPEPDDSPGEKLEL